VKQFAKETLDNFSSDYPGVVNRNNINTILKELIEKN